LKLATQNFRSGINYFYVSGVSACLKFLAVSFSQVLEANFLSGIASISPRRWLEEWQKTGQWSFLEAPRRAERQVCNRLLKD
jgi:hypothetical protein